LITVNVNKLLTLLFVFCLQILVLRWAHIAWRAIFVPMIMPSVLTTRVHAALATNLLKTATAVCSSSCSINYCPR